MLAAMGAIEELRSLSDRSGMGDALIDAYMIAGDVESLELLAADSSDPERQLEAIEALGIAGGDEAGPKLLGIYRGSDSPDVREAAVEGLMLSGNDEAMLELFRESQDRVRETSAPRDAGLDGLRRRLGPHRPDAGAIVMSATFRVPTWALLAGALLLAAITQ